MKKSLKIYMWPLWLVGVFSQSKSFRDNPIIGSRVLNRLGLHIFRILISRLATGFKWFILSPFLKKEHRQQFHENGFLIIENFIGPETLNSMKSELKDLPDDARQMIQGDTYTQRILLDHKALKNTFRLKETVTGKHFLNPLYYCGAKWHRPIVYLQQIKNGKVSGRDDPQKSMHSDSFQPTVKAWLFLEDVPKEKGPFTYVRGSNKLSLRRLRWEYGQSIKGPENMDTYSARGSLRASPSDLSEMGLKAPESLQVKAGTLVIANTNGFHGRGMAKDGESRMEVWAYARYHPFNPFPGLSSGYLHRIETSVLQAFYRYKDRKAERNGSRASWHKINVSDMLD